jgi:hypothetical protein
MKTIKIYLLVIMVLMINNHAWANLKYHPVSFVLSTDKDSYYEGEKITFNITITNTSNENTYPVLLPHTQNIGQKLFYLNAYDKANNSLILRYTENKMLNMMVYDTGTVKIRYLKPQEQIVIPIYLNDFDNYYNYHTQNNSHHSFGVPLFAGLYKVNVTYNPRGILLGDSIYTYYNDFDKYIPNEEKQSMPTNGQITQMIDLKIKRSKDTIISIERTKYYIKTDGYRYFYLSKNLPQITTDTTCHHITDLPTDSFSIKNEYFYSHFTDLYAEYIARFDDGDIREYRRFTDYCPDYLYTERYDAFKQKTSFMTQLNDKRFYSVSYHQPGNKIDQETYCSANGTQCNVTTFVYNKKGEFKYKEITQTQPCIEVEIDGKKRSYKLAKQLEGL